MTTPRTVRAEQGLIESLLDFSFTSLATSKLIKAIYVLTFAWVAISAIAWFVFLVSWGGGFGVLLALIAVPLVSLIIIALARVILEYLIVVDRIHENVANIQAEMPASPRSEAPASEVPASEPASTPGEAEPEQTGVVYPRSESS